jgi:hypothetical protein
MKNQEIHANDIWNDNKQDELKQFILLQNHYESHLFK